MQHRAAHKVRWSGIALLALLCAVGGSAFAAKGKSSCADCAQMNAPHKPFQIYGNTYYVGTDQLSAILITSDYGHVLIDAGLPESAAQIAANIEALGFKVSDIKGILNSHAHLDHAGGIAELQRLSGADVYALRPANEVLMAGKLPKDDPQFGAKDTSFPPVPRVWVVQDDQLLGLGSLRVRAVATPGHTPGGTSWTWDACEGSKCLKAVYADSLTAVAADKYRFSEHPEVLAAFQHSFTRLEAEPCELLLTPHPAASKLFERLDKPRNTLDSVRDAGACKAYVQGARDALAKRLDSEKQGK